MKTRLTRQSAIAIFAMGIGACFLIAQPALASGKPVGHFGTYTLKGPGEEEPVKKSKAKSRSFSSRNNSSVKIYPDAVKRTMHVVAKENEGREIDFFVFDLEGTLIQNYKMKAKDHVKIQGLARGSYVYRVFCGDEETAAGNFDIR